MLVFLLFFGLLKLLKKVKKNINLDSTKTFYMKISIKGLLYILGIFIVLRRSSLGFDYSLVSAMVSILTSNICDNFTTISTLVFLMSLLLCLRLVSMSYETLICLAISLRE